MNLISLNFIKIEINLNGKKKSILFQNFGLVATAKYLRLV